MLILKQEKYTSLFGELSVWRNKTYVFEKENKSGILPFVTGLRFSANIAYIANELFVGSNLRAVWGHIINEDIEYNIYSRESDIIIHKNIPGCYIRNWNGNKQNHIMDFHFVNKAAAVGVISCKSMITSFDKTIKEYPQQMKDFTRNIWLFAECCGLNRESTLRSVAKANGYKSFWSLYSWHKEKGSMPNQTSWNDFEKAMLKLANKYP